ncbi:MAG: TetR/AcrR family transcriptional regulator [Pseudomonadota bacterium]
MATSNEINSAAERTKEKILDAAEALFAQERYKGTSVERVARNVPVSKTTIYKYFDHKDGLFEATARRFASRILAEVTSEFTAHDTIEEQISSALIRKHKLCYEIRASSFAKELFEARHGVVRAIVGDLMTGIESAILRALIEVGMRRADATRCARLIAATSIGLANTHTTRATTSKDLRFMVRAIVSSRE